MRFIDITCKIGNMRKAASFTVCPKATPDSREVTIQSDKRIARINLDTGKVVLSDGKGGHPGFHKLLAICGAVELDCPADVLEQLRGLDSEGKLPGGPVRIMG
jgi:hypothetical protein